MTPCAWKRRLPRVTVGVALGLMMMLAWGQHARGEQDTVEVLRSPHLLEARPKSKDISLAEYSKLKQEYIRRNEHWRPGSALTYDVRTWRGDRRGHWLTLDSFDETHAWVAELTQYRSKGWDWVVRWRLMRSTEADAELEIPRILEERARVVAGVRYGMSVAEVFALKERHYRSHPCQAAGSGYLVYDNVRFSVTGWWSDSKGRVGGVEATSDRTKEYMKGTRYEDEEPPQTQPTVAEPIGGADPRASGGTP